MLKERAQPRSGGDAHRVVIVGAGAAGTLTAVHLLRGQTDGPLEVVLVDAAGTFGPGVAYGTQNPLHLLNVPAVRMGGIAARPEHFHEWLLEQGARVAADEFVPRSLFGAYLRALLEESAIASEPDVSLRRIEGEAVSLRGAAPGSRAAVVLAGGERIEADHIVLALGPPPGGDPAPVPEELRATRRYVKSPWAAGALAAAAADESVLIVGTGLTMVDVALSLASEHPGLRLRAISRHGLTPRRHRRDLTRIRRFPIPAAGSGLESIALTLLDQVTRVAQQGDDWRDVIDSARPAIPAVWRGLRLEEKRRFLADLQRLWEVHRFRMAPAAADRLDALQAEGRLRIDARSIVALEPHGDRVRVSLRAVGAPVEAVEFDRVVNCCGAGANLAGNAPTLVADLLASGLARDDGLGLGLDVGLDGALIDADGREGQPIHVVGALRKGVELETVSVTEIRDQADAAARAALHRTAARPLRV